MIRGFNYYVLRNKKAVSVSSAEEWAKEFDGNGWNDRKRVAETMVWGWRVSTVFLGLDHQFGDGPLLLFETMVFRRGGWSEDSCNRYSTWEEAEMGHARIVRQYFQPVALARGVWMDVKLTWGQLKQQGESGWEMLKSKCSALWRSARQ